MATRRAAGSSPPTSARDAEAVREKPATKASPRSSAGGLPRHSGDVAQVAEAEQRSPVTPGIKAAGESYRRGIHPLHFFRIALRSSSKVSGLVNVLWPAVPVAIAVKYARPEWHLAIFILAYVSMVPCANLIGFAGQELARKFSHVYGVLVETCLGSVVEIVLFMVLLSRDQFQVVQAAILGSILATMLLCLGLCFFAGGIRRDVSTFDEAVSEAGSGLLLTAGLGLAVPTVFRWATDEEDTALLVGNTLQVSRITAILLIIAYFVFVWFQARSHHSIYDAIFKYDEERDHDGAEDRSKDKLTFTECVAALAVSTALVTIIAISLVDEIAPIVETRGISDPFMGLILVPLVEKAAEHLTAIDEAWDDQMNFALSHVLGATLQTALFNAPLVVIVGWGLDKPMGLDFDLFNITVLLVAIVTVGNFLRDQKSNYLEGVLCVIVYIAVAVAAFYSPNPHEAGGTEAGGASTGEGGH